MAKHAGDPGSQPFYAVGGDSLLPRIPLFTDRLGIYRQIEYTIV